jgi:CRP/FNR family cyclic AMP-dependent transcriptional regulator
MSSPARALAPQKLREDPLDYLPCSPILEYKKGETIYNPDHVAQNLYLVISGIVKVSRIAPGGREVVIDLYQADEFFGEAMFLAAPTMPELSVAMAPARLMSWSAAQIEELSTKRPQLAIGLLELWVQRSLDYLLRIESFSCDDIGRRLARALVRFSERLGSRGDDGSCQMIPFSHDLLSQYVGTSRAIITGYMNQFRREGYLRYSRRGTFVRDEAIKAWLRTNS